MTNPKTQFPGKFLRKHLATRSAENKSEPLAQGNTLKILPIESKTSSTPNPEELIATDRVIEIAKRLGVSFGRGDPMERIRYFVKLGILPHAIRKTPNQLPDTSHQIPVTTFGLPAKALAPAGHFPYWVVKRLIVVDRLNRSGMPFPEIAAKLKNTSPNNPNIPNPPNPTSRYQLPATGLLAISASLWKKAGISEEELDKKLQGFQTEIDQKLQKHKQELQKTINLPPDQNSLKGNLNKLSESDLNSLTGYQSYLKKGPEAEEVREVRDFGELPNSQISPTTQTSLPSEASAKEGPTPQTNPTESPATSNQTPGTRHRSLKKPLFASALAALFIFAILLSILQSPAVRQALNKADSEKAHQIASQNLENAQSLGAVLAASSEANKLYIDAVTEFKGETTFLDPITAPNIIYSVTGGTGIAVTAGQNPVVSLDSTEIVTTLNSTSGALTIAGSGGTSVSTSGSTITISSTSASSTSGDITAVNAGNGLTGGASSGDASLAISLTTSGTSTTTSTASGLEFSSGLSLVRGCSNSQVLAWITATATWDCTTTSSGFTSFDAAGDSGTNQTITNGNTLTIAGGTNGIDTVGTATDIVTLNLDTTEIGTTTFGSGSSLVWTFDAGSTDPTIDFNSGSIVFNEAGADIDLRIEADNNANIFTLDAGLFSGVGQISLGASAQSTATAFVVVDNPAVTATSNQNFYKAYIDNSAAVTITGATTSSIVASLAIDEPNITATGTVTNASTIYVSGAPTEGSSGNFALWVDDGQSRFENTPVSGSTTGSAVTIVPTYVVEATDITLSGLRLALDSNSNADSGDVFYGFNADDFTTTSGPTEYGLRIGSGYDYQFYFELGTRDLRISATAPSAGTSPLTATIPALAADDTFCLATLANCFGAGGGAGVTYTSQVTNALTKFTSTTGQITSSGITDDGTTLTLPANRSLTMTAGTGSITENFSPAGTTGTARALTVTPTFGIDATDQTLTGVYINPNTNSNGDSGDVLNGILIDTITASSASEYALQIGSGWDQNIYLNDTTTSVLLADGGTITITDGTNTLCSIADAGTTGNLTCTGNITGSSSGSAGFWTRTSTTLSPTTANDIVSIANTNTSGADLAITNTGIYTGTGLTAITANSATSGDILTISATALSTGTALTLTGPTSTGVTDHFLKVTSDVGSVAALIYGAPDFSGSAVTGYGLNITATDSTANANTDYGIYSSLALTGNAAKTGYGISSTVTNTSTTAATEYAGYFSLSDTGIVTSGTDNSYGLYSTATRTGSTTAGTYNTYGGYFTTTADSGGAGTTNAYGLYATATGGDNNYAGYFSLANTGQVYLDLTLSAAARSVDALTITQANDATFNSTGNLLQLTNNDTGSTAAVVDILQLASRTGIQITSGGSTNSKDIDIETSLGSNAVGIEISNMGGGIGISFADATHSGTGIDFIDLTGTSAIGIDFGNGDIRSGGAAIKLADTTTGGAAFVGDYILFAPNRTGVGTADNTGNFIDLQRIWTAGVGDAITLSGDVATFSSNCTVTSGTCTDTSDILSLTQSYASASGNVINISNSATTNDVVNLTTSSTTTGSAFVATGPSSTGVTDHFLKITSDVGSASALIYGAPDFSGSGVTGYGLNITATDSTANANTDYGMYSSLALTGNAAKTGYADYATVTSSSTTGDTTYGQAAVISLTGAVSGTAQASYGLYSTATKTGADTSVAATTLYGLYATASNTGSTDAGTKNTYGAYLDATGDTAGTASVFGLYLADVSGGDTNVALCFDCDGTFGTSTVASGIQWGTDANAVSLYRSASDILRTGDGLTVDLDLIVTGNDITFGSGESISLQTDNTIILASDASAGAGVVRLPVKTDTGDPSLNVEGNIYYNTFDNVFRCYQSSAWTNCIGSGAAPAWSAITDPTGDLNLTFEAGETNTFTLSETTDTFWTFTGTAFTTGEVFDISTTHAPANGSTNEAIDINITHTPTVSADNFQSINLTTTDGTALGNTVYGISNTLTLTGNAAKTGIGYYGTVTSSSTTADTLAVYDAATSVTGIITTGARNVYGLRSQPDAGAESTGGTTNVYGLYSKVAGDVADGGAVNNYGLYVANGTYDTGGVSSAYGIFVEEQTGADFNKAAILRGQVDIGTTSGTGALLAAGSAYTATITRTTTELTNADLVGRWTAIAIGADGLPVIAYYNTTDGDLNVTKCGNVSCSSGNTTTEISNGDDVGSYASLAIGTDGLPVISHFNDTDNDLNVTKCGNAACSSGNTTTEITTADDDGRYTSIAIGPDGFPVISYENAQALNLDLNVTKCGNASCSSGNTTTEISNADNVGQYTSVAIGTDGLPVIAYSNQTDFNLNITKCGNVSCSSGNTTTEITNADNTRQYISIAIGADGLPVISHYNASDNEPNVTKCGNAACSSGNTSTEITLTELAGRWTAIAIGTDGLPVIAYYNIDDGDLNVNKCGNLACSSGNTTTKLTSGDDYGEYASMAIGADGLPIVAEHNATDGDLNVTQCADGACSGATATALAGGIDIGSPNLGFRTLYGLSANFGGDVYIGSPIMRQDNALLGSSVPFSEGNLIVTSAATTTNPVSIFAPGLTSGTGIAFTGPSATGITGSAISLTSDVGSAGELINLAPDFSGAGVTGQGVTLVATDSTSSANTDYGIYSSLALTGNIGKTGVGYYGTVTSSSTTGDTLVVFDAATSVTGIIGGATTRSVYGLRSQPDVGAESTAGTTNVYGVYSKATGDVADSGTITNYGVYVANGTYDSGGTSTAYGLYIEDITGADTNIEVNLASTTPTFAIGGGGTLAFTDGTNTLVSVVDNGTYGFLRLSDKGGTGDPASCTVGDVYFNNTDDVFKGCINTDSWVALTSGSLASLQSAYGNDVDGSDAIIALTTADDSLIFRNPSASGTDSAYTVFIDQLHTTGAVSALDIATASNGSDAVNITANSVDGETILDISGTGLTSGTGIKFTGSTSTGITGNVLSLTSDVGSAGELINLAPDFSGAGVTGQGVTLVATDSTSSANTDYGYNSTLTLTGNAAKTGYGISSTVTNTSTTAATEYAGYFSLADTGIVTSGTDNSYGIYSTATRTGSTTAGTYNTYGGYFTTTADAGGAGTTNAYGIYATATGGDNNYSAYLNGNVLVGKQTDAGGTASSQTLRSQTNEGQIASGGTDDIDGVVSSAVYNGSIYIGTFESGAAQVYRWDGGTTWTVINTTAGRFGTTTSIDGVTSMTVYDGYLYIATEKANSAEVYRYDGGTGTSVFTAINTTAGRFQTTTSIDGVNSMIVSDGQIYIGTNEIDGAEVYRYEGATGTSVFTALNTTAGNVCGQTSVNSVRSLASYNGNVYAGTEESNAAEVCRYDGGTTLTRVVSAAGTVTSGGRASIDVIRSLAVFNGSLYVGTEEAGAAEIYRYTGSGTDAAATNLVWIQVNATDGTICSQTSVDGSDTMTVYNGILYIGTTETGLTEVCRYDGGNTFTSIVNAAGQIASGELTGIDEITTMTPYNNNGSDLLFIGTTNDTGGACGANQCAEVYSFTGIEGQSFALLFNAVSDNGGGEQNSFLNLGSISFAAEQPRTGDTGNSATGSFLLSHAITTVAGGYDVAEDYPTRDESLQSGDLVSVDTAEKGFVKKAQGAYDNQVLGIYSENPGLRLSQKDGLIDGAKAVPIALAGRVPVKVSLENGPIKAGDSITSSSTPGVGMKATQPGRVIGIALESFDAPSVILACPESDNDNPNPVCAQATNRVCEQSIPADPVSSEPETGSAQANSPNYELSTQNCTGKVLVYVNPTFYMGSSMALDEWSTLIAKSLVQSQQLSQEAGDLHTLLAADITKAEELLAKLENKHVPTEEEITRLVKDEVSSQLISLGYVNYEATGSAQAAGPSALSAQTNKTLSDLNNLLATSNLQLDTLSITGNTQLAQTQIAGTLSQDGTLIIDYGRQINVLGSTLFLQNDSLAGCPPDHDTGSDHDPVSCKSGILVDIGRGRLTVDSQGNLIAQGEIEAKGIVLFESAAAPTVGSSQILAGASSVIIETSAIKPGAKVLITATGPTGGKSIYLSQKTDYTGFTVAIENGPAAQKIEFDWLIINTSQISSN